MMRYTIRQVGLGFMLSSFLLVVAPHGNAEENAYSSPLAVAVHDGKIYVAEHTANALAVLDADSERVERTIGLSHAPSGVAVSPDGTRLYVTAGGAEGIVLIVDTESGATTASMPAGHTPTAPILDPSGAVLFVSNRFANDISVFDLASGTLTKRIPATREPFASAMTPDGSLLYVANLLPSGAANAGYVGAAIDVVDVHKLERIASIPLPNGSTGVHGICVSPDGRYAYATHILARYLLPTTQLERGWINTNAVSVVDTRTNTRVNTFLLDDIDRGAANPWGVACSGDGKQLYVVHAGTNELSVIDRDSLHRKLDAAASSGTAETVPNDLAFLVGIRQRHRLDGIGPRGIAVADSRIYAAEYFSSSVAVATIEDSESVTVRSVSLGNEPDPDVVRAGEQLFHDATVCFQQWQSCASCHPGDGRADALNWDLLNDGMGNPKNNKSLILSHKTPPAMSTGVRDTAEMAVRAGIQHILFAVLPDEKAVSLDEYLKSLTPVPSPRLVNGSLSESAERGKAVFETAGCNRCHPAPLFTDQKHHRVGTGTGREEETSFDTPTLVEVWRTAPYLYDGRAATIEEVFTTFNNNDRHGETSALTEQQLDDLVAYVESL